MTNELDADDPDIELELDHEELIEAIEKQVLARIDEIMPSLEEGLGSDHPAVMRLRVACANLRAEMDKMYDPIWTLH